ncbi:MAG: hypothetical protein AAF439_08250 [Pseudomonadota bacterium]
MPKDGDIKWTYYADQHPDHVLGDLKGYIRQRQNDAAGTLEYWYVGQTDNPDLRLAQHQSSCAGRSDAPWTDMFVIYGHTDLGYVTKVENELIEYLNMRAGKRGEDDRVLNVKGAQYRGNQTFSVYILIDDNPTSSSGAKQQSAAREPSTNKSHCFAEGKKKVDTQTREKTVIAKFDAATKVDTGGYTRPAQYIYVGFTNDPARRYREHQGKMKKEFGGNVWQEMRVVYQTPSLNDALDVETLLIDHARKTFPGTVHNTERGRFAQQRDKDEQPYFYVYYMEDRR